MTLRRSPAKDDTIDVAERQTQAERRETAERSILDAAKVIIAERGMDDLSMSEIGEAAGYSRALPGHYYGSKSALIHALADHILAGYAERMRSGAIDSQGLELLLHVIEFCIDDAAANPDNVRAYQIILINGLTRPDLKPLVDRMIQQSINDIGGLIALAQSAGEVRKDADPYAEAALIIASMRGVLFQWLINPDHVSLSRMRDSLVTNVRNSLTA